MLRGFIGHAVGCPARVRCGSADVIPVRPDAPRSAAYCRHHDHGCGAALRLPHGPIDRVADDDALFNNGMAVLSVKQVPPFDTVEEPNPWAMAAAVVLLIAAAWAV